MFARGEGSPIDAQDDTVEDTDRVGNDKASTEGAEEEEGEEGKLVLGRRAMGFDFEPESLPMRLCMCCCIWATTVTSLAPWRWIRAAMSSKLNEPLDDSVEDDDEDTLLFKLPLSYAGMLAGGRGGKEGRKERTVKEGRQKERHDGKTRRQREDGKRKGMK